MGRSNAEARSGRMPSYNPKDIEPRWQRYWDEHKTFRTPDLSDKPKFYILDMFPYPSGAGLHVCHPEGYTATDILARYRRMRGMHVLHPMGWDAFGLPAEQYAIETGTHPRETTRRNIATFRRQIQSLGFSYDWDREVDTTDPAYFKYAVDLPRSVRHLVRRRPEPGPADQRAAHPGGRAEAGRRGRARLPRQQT